MKVQIIIMKTTKFLSLMDIDSSSFYTIYINSSADKIQLILIILIN